MTTGQKVLVGVLVVIVALFAVSITVGRTNDDKTDSGLVDLLKEKLGTANPVQPSELSGACPLTATQLAVTGTCTVEVASSSVALRHLLLHNDATVQVDVTSRVPEGKGTADAPLEPGKDLSIAIDGDATSVVLRCTALQTCHLTIGGS